MASSNGPACDKGSKPSKGFVVHTDEEGFDLHTLRNHVKEYIMARDAEGQRIMEEHLQLGQIDPLPMHWKATDHWNEYNDNMICTSIKIIKLLGAILAEETGCITYNTIHTVPYYTVLLPYEIQVLCDGNTKNKKLCYTTPEGIGFIPYSSPIEEKYQDQVTTHIKEKYSEEIASFILTYNSW